jgi:hypothetical protein
LNGAAIFEEGDVDVVRRFAGREFSPTMKITKVPSVKGVSVTL